MSAREPRCRRALAALEVKQEAHKAVDNAAAAGFFTPREVRAALERFLRAVVRVTGGDTLLPDALADALGNNG